MEKSEQRFWAEIREDKKQWGTPTSNHVEPSPDLGLKGPGEERALRAVGPLAGAVLMMAQVIARPGCWSREEWGRNAPTSVSPTPPLPCQCEASWERRLQRWVTLKENHLDSDWKVPQHSSRFFCGHKFSTYLSKYQQVQWLNCMANL